MDSLALASLLFAVNQLGAPLIVVMGHEACGAIKASLADDKDLASLPQDLHNLVGRLREGYDKRSLPAEGDDRVLAACVSNVESLVGDPEIGLGVSTTHLIWMVYDGTYCDVTWSYVQVHELENYVTLDEKVKAGQLRVVGSYYNLHGGVTFFD
jgi:carbonic anhydrase